MQVKLTVGRAGTDHTQNPGEIVTVSDREGARLIESGQGIPVIDDTHETATATPPEARSKKKAASKKRGARS